MLGQQLERVVILVCAVGCGNKRTCVDDEHLAAPEPLGEYLVGFRRTSAGSRLAYGGEGQPTTHRYGLGQLRREELRCQLVRSLTTTGRLSGQRLRDGIVKMQRQCHGISVTANARRPAPVGRERDAAGQARLLAREGLRRP
jgi:hypothetical protein